MWQSVFSAEAHKLWMHVKSALRRCGCKFSIYSLMGSQTLCVWSLYSNARCPCSFILTYATCAELCFTRLQALWIDLPWNKYILATIIVHMTCAHLPFNTYTRCYYVVHHFKYLPNNQVSRDAHFQQCKLLIRLICNYACTLATYFLLSMLGVMERHSNGKWRF